MIIMSHYGTRRQTSVSPYKRTPTGSKGRGKGGRYIKKKIVGGHTRNAINWGTAIGIPLQPVIQIKYKFKANSHEYFKLANVPKEVRTHVQGKSDFDAQFQLYLWYMLLEPIVKEGVEKGIEQTEEFIKEAVPQRTGKLQKALIQSMVYYKNRFPVTVKVGAPHVRYASIINRYTHQEVQIRHRPGKQISGRNQPYNYKAGKGDIKSMYHFLKKVKTMLNKNIYHHIAVGLTKEKIPHDVVQWMLIRKKVTTVWK